MEGLCGVRMWGILLWGKVFYRDMPVTILTILRGQGVVWRLRLGDLIIWRYARSIVSHKGAVLVNGGGYMTGDVSGN